MSEHQRLNAPQFTEGQRVEASYAFNGNSAEDLPFKKKEVLVIIKQTKDPMWYIAENEKKYRGLIPANFVKRICHISENTWFFGKISREQTESLLLGEADGVFLVRESVNYPGDYTLSVACMGKVEHYRIHHEADGFTLDDGQKFRSITALLETHMQEGQGLCTPLVTGLDRTALAPKRTAAVPAVAPDSRALPTDRPPVASPIMPGVRAERAPDDFGRYLQANSNSGSAPAGPRNPVAEAQRQHHSDPTRSSQMVASVTRSLPLLNYAALSLGELIGKGEFGEVTRGTYQGHDVAVKKLKESSKAAQSVLQEAQLMSELHHENLVRFLGIIRYQDSVFIVTEYMAKGNLVDYLRTRGRSVIGKQSLLQFSLDACSGMKYLELQNVVHRDLAARNILVGEDDRAKVSDFGLARHADDHHQEGGKFPIKWTAPEALRQNLFTSKSDVWSFGILLWEVYSYGRNPYPRIPLAEVTRYVENGYNMESPDGCQPEIYSVMKACWNLDPSKRPSFVDIERRLQDIRRLVAT